MPAPGVCLSKTSSPSKLRVPCMCKCCPTASPSHFVAAQRTAHTFSDLLLLHPCSLHQHTRSGKTLIALHYFFQPTEHTSQPSNPSHRQNGASSPRRDSTTARNRFIADASVRLVQRARHSPVLYSPLRPELHHFELCQPLGPILLSHRFPRRGRHLRHRGLQGLPCSRQER